MSKKYTFNDILIKPSFSNITSRKEVDISSNLNGLQLKIPIISANMDTVTEIKMCNALGRLGAIGCFHRFMDVCESSRQLNGVKYKTIASFGLGTIEQARALELYEVNNIRHFCLDVAHGAQQQVVEQVQWFKSMFKDTWLMVGNFADPESTKIFWDKCTLKPEAIKIGIGPGSACTTRIKTGVGVPQLSAISEVADIWREKNDGPAIIADGGMKNSGDIAKALACGANAVMLGGMLAGTEESPGDVYGELNKPETWHKIYRGSASKESYVDQKKDWDCAEGETFSLKYKGNVDIIIKELVAGLKSSFSYVGAKNLDEFQQNSEFILISENAMKESLSYGKN